MGEKIIVGGPRHVEPDCAWWEDTEEASGAELARRLFQTVRSIEHRQSSIAEGHRRHGEIYASYSPLGLSWGSAESVRPPGQATRNVIRSVCDTATALISKAWPRPRIVTDGGDWEVQQRAEMLDRFLVGVYRRAKIYSVAQLAFRDSTIYGTGAFILRECGRGKDYYLKAERLLISDLVIDEQECPSGQDPVNYYVRKVMHKNAAVRMYAKGDKERKAAILAATGKQPLSWPGNQQVPKDYVVVIEAWHIAQSGEKDGIYVQAIDGLELDRKAWPHGWAPIITLYWSPPLSGFYGDGVAYRQYGRQRRINYLYRWIMRCQDLIAVPRVWVDAVNGPLKVQISNEIGEIVGYHGQKPEFQTPQAVGNEVYAWLDRLEQGGFDDEGISQATATNQLPVGIESAPAQREYAFKEGTRFAPVSQRWEDAIARECATKCLALYKEHATGTDIEEGSPTVVWTAKNLREVIDWDNVDLETEQYEIRVEASSLEELSPAGRIQAVIELAQTGWIEPDMGRKLLGHPDIEREDEISNASRKYAEWVAVNLKRGTYVPPNNYGDIADQEEVVKAELLNAEMGGAQKSRAGRKAMELMRQFLRAAKAELAPLDAPVVPGQPGSPDMALEAPPPAMSVPAANNEELMMPSAPPPFLGM